jgi:hypothetical protein
VPHFVPHGFGSTDGWREADTVSICRGIVGVLSPSWHWL